MEEEEEEEGRGGGGGGGGGGRPEWNLLPWGQQFCLLLS